MHVKTALQSSVFAICIFFVPELSFGKTYDYPMLAVNNDEWRSTCSLYETLARTVMKSRQSGMSMSKMMEKAKDIEIAEAIIVEAYNKPNYSTDRMQQKEINEFANTVYRECVNEYR